jgi:DNA-binding transcriptional MerR regulator
MAYSVKELADLAGVSTRTLHYYDEIGLLPPSATESNSYRSYDQAAVLRLQQILFYKELGLSLKEIKSMMDTPDYDIVSSLEVHKKDLEQKAGRILDMLDTIEKTIMHAKGDQLMSDADLFKGFDEAQQEQYEKEVVKRWGSDNPAYLQSKQRWGSYSDERKGEILGEMQAITLGLVEHIEKGPADPDVQELVVRQHRWVNLFWDCGYEQFEALGQGYATDPKFSTMYQDYHPDLPEFFYKAIQYYVETNKE